MRRPSLGPTILLVGLAVGALIIGLSLARNTSHKDLLRPVTQPSTSPEITANEPAPLAPASPTPNSSSSATGTTSSQAAEPGSSSVNTSSNNQCVVFTREQVRSYNNDVKKEKEALESTLSIPMGVNNSINFVEEYNTKAVTLHQKYLADAKKANCTFPIKEPALLPTTYPN